MPSAEDAPNQHGLANPEIVGQLRFDTLQACRRIWLGGAIAIGGFFNPLYESYARFLSLGRDGIYLTSSFYYLINSSTRLVATTVTGLHTVICHNSLISIADFGQPDLRHFGSSIGAVLFSSAQCLPQ